MASSHKEYPKKKDSSKSFQQFKFKSKRISLHDKPSDLHKKNPARWSFKSNEEFKKLISLQKSTSTPDHGYDPSMISESFFERQGDDLLTRDVDNQLNVSENLNYKQLKRALWDIQDVQINKSI